MYLPGSNKKGFTLVELMIAISIVAILATVGFTVYSNTQINARDAKRKQDIDAIATAIEGRKVPGQTTYSPVSAADFSGGTIPTDPKAAATTNPQVYCLLSLVTVPPPPPPAITVSSTFTSKTTCANTLNAPENVMTTALPLATTTSWTVCAFLEQGTNAIYCKTSN